MDTIAPFLAEKEETLRLLESCMILVLAIDPELSNLGFGKFCLKPY